MPRAGVVLATMLAGWGAIAAEPLELEVEPSDVVAVQLTILLGPDATRRLEQATARTVGSDLTVTIGGVHAFTATTQGVVASGSMAVRPTPELLTRLEGILRARARGEPEHGGARPDEPARIDVGGGDVKQIGVDVVLRRSGAVRLAEATHTAVPDGQALSARARLADRSGTRGLRVAIERVELAITVGGGLFGSLELAGTPEVLAALRDFLVAQAKAGPNAPPR